MGVLPPVDLSAIRATLAEPGIRLASRHNPDGHSIVEVLRDGKPSVLIHHDGRIQHLCRSAG